MPKFRGPINLLLGFDEKAKAPEVVSDYDAGNHNYVVKLTAAGKKKWADTLEAHGFAEEKDDAPEPEATDAQE